MLTLCLEYCKNNPALAIVLLALVAFLFFVLCTIAVLSIKARIAKKRLRTAVATTKEAQEETTLDSSSASPTVENDTAEETDVVEGVAADESPVETEEPVTKIEEEIIIEPIVNEEPVAYIEEEVVIEPIVNEEPVADIEEDIATEPIVNEEPVADIEEEVVIEPIVNEEPLAEIEEEIIIEPIVEKEPVAEIEEEIIIEPIIEEEPVTKIEEAIIIEPIVNEEPVADIEKEAVLEPIVNEEPVADIEEEVVIEPIVNEEPVADIEEDIIIEPIVNEEPVTDIEEKIPVLPSTAASVPNTEQRQTPPVRRELHTSSKPSKQETRKQLTAEQKEAFRKQLVEKIVERLGKTHAVPKTATSSPLDRSTPETDKTPIPQKEQTSPIPSSSPVPQEHVSPVTASKIPQRTRTEENDDVQVDFTNEPNTWEQGPKTLLDELKDVDTRLDFYEEDEIDQQARHCGKWVIYRVITEDKTPTEEELYFFELHAANGEKLLSGEEYPTYASALRGIETHKTNILRGNCKIFLSAKGEYFFKLRSGKNLLLCVSEPYATKTQCETAIRSIQRFAKTAIVDENLEDHIVNVPMEETTPLPPLDLSTGKWIIGGTKNENEEMIYSFDLFTADGEKILSSEEYMTYIGAVNGIQTYKTNIEQGNFRITLTKFGDYIYKLLNKNGQLLCLGEHYKTKQRCIHAVEAIRQSAKNAPVLSDPKLVEQTEPTNAK